MPGATPDYVPTPEEIAQRAAAIRRGWTDRNGVLQVPARGNSPKSRGPGIRETSADGSQRRHGRLPEETPESSGEWWVGSGEWGVAR